MQDTKICLCIEQIHSKSMDTLRLNTFQSYFEKFVNFHKAENCVVCLSR
jgi:hypothetical protein